MFCTTLLTRQHFASSPSPFLSYNFGGADSKLPMSGSAKLYVFEKA